MDPVCNPLTVSPIQMGWKVSIQLNQMWWFGYINNPHCPFSNGLVSTQTQTWTDSLEPLLKLLNTLYKLFAFIIFY